MDLFDECILNVLRDGKPRDFHQLLEEVDFSHNTLRLHLRRLTNRGLIAKERIHSKGRGRPKFTYSLPPKLRRQASRLLSDPLGDVVTLSFRKLRHLCRYEKGGYCKKTKGNCAPQNCPQILKRE